MPDLPDPTRDEFYIGWQKSAPPHLAHRIRRCLVLLGVIVAVVSAAAALALHPVKPGVFEFGVIRPWTGVFEAEPVPMLRVVSSDGTPGATFLVCGPGKFGPPPELVALTDRKVSLSGSLIATEGATMLQVDDPASVRDLGLPASNERVPDRVNLGDGVFSGELVDTKCFLGVMRPATGKVHRACAIRCLSGGAPPALLVRTASGNDVTLLLAATEGGQFNVAADLAGRVLEVRGSLEVAGQIPILRVRAAQVVGD